MTMITPSYLGETIEYSSLHACRSTLEDPTGPPMLLFQARPQPRCSLVPSPWTIASSSRSPVAGHENPVIR